MFGFLKRIFGTAQDRAIRNYRKVVEEINRWDEKYKAFSDEELQRKTVEFKERFSKGETLEQLLPEAFAVVKSACRRLIGTEIHVSGYDQKWDMVPYDVQLIGAIALNSGSIAEMMTGEGKTLTAVLPLYLNALTGKPVHLVTVNDYLAQRDCQWVGTVLRWLGLTTASLTHDTSPDQRKKVYEADVVYGTASEFGFDYLRDNSVASTKDQQVQRGYFFAIIDEVDSILIDEARTPLIISGPTPVSRQLYDSLKEGVGHLVRKQRDLCSRWATEARRVLEKGVVAEGAPAMKKDKAQQEEEREALRKLWLVSKGTPRNRILTHMKEDPNIRAGVDECDLYFYAEQNKEERVQALSDLYMIVDEKSSEFELTDKGSQGWHECTEGVGSSDDFVMLDLGHEFALIDEDTTLDGETKVQKRLEIQEEDQKRKERAHNLRQLLRAHLLMDKDVDYIIQDNKIIIIDENTGRAQPGRRFSDGLHQAIEAKEGVEIQRETQTFATITLQNFFRMYTKLAGMTGTATTEAGEFKQVYKLEVLEIPTHKVCKRVDNDDEIYMSEREKYNAILKDVKAAHEAGRPILIGTESVDISEKLSRILKQHKLEHTVLNAKQNEKEAEIVAHAGRRSAITIATNMAGRGTDIKLEQGIAALGGLYVMGTTRHQSRRIDRQLRGRCARQGDPGSSKFYVSFEDTLLRLFAAPRLTAILQRFRPPEGEPISAPILNKSIETAQKRIEQRNAAIRKHTLEYDDVMNKQRQEIYAFRNDVLHTDEIPRLVEELLAEVCSQAADMYFQDRSSEGGWDPEGYRHWLMRHFPVSFSQDEFDEDLLDKEEIEKRASNKVIAAFRSKLEHENGKVAAATMGGIEPLRRPTDEAMRNMIVRRIDQLWQEHLLKMDHLRSDVTLRTVGQRDPLMEFKHDAFTMFNEFSNRLKADIAHDLFRFEIVIRPMPVLQDVLASLQLETGRSLVSGFDDAQLSPQPESSNVGPSEPIKSQPIVSDPRTGRNDNCPCGSGKKYKKCCGINQEADVR